MYAPKRADEAADEEAAFSPLSVNGKEDVPCDMLPLSVFELMCALSACERSSPAYVSGIPGGVTSTGNPAETVNPDFRPGVGGIIGHERKRPFDDRGISADETGRITHCAEEKRGGRGKMHAAAFAGFDKKIAHEICFPGISADLGVVRSAVSDQLRERLNALVF